MCIDRIRKFLDCGCARQGSQHAHRETCTLWTGPWYCLQLLPYVGGFNQVHPKILSAYPLKTPANKENENSPTTKLPPQTLLQHRLTTKRSCQNTFQLQNDAHCVRCNVHADCGIRCATIFRYVTGACLTAAYFSFICRIQHLYVA